MSTSELWELRLVIRVLRHAAMLGLVLSSIMEVLGNILVLEVLVLVMVSAGVQLFSLAESS